MKDKRTPSSDLETIIPILIGVWRRFTKESGPEDRLQTREFRTVVTSIEQLQKGVDKPDYFEDRTLLAAYMLYPWVIHYQEGMSLIGEIPFTPRRVLDVCSGGAPFAFAALRHGAEEVFATDQNMSALQLGAEVCARYGLPLTIRKWNCLKERLPIEGKFDLIILGHCLDELFPNTVKGWQDVQHAFITKLMSRLTPQGMLLVVDSSQLDSNNRILQMRDKLVQTGVPVQAPCVWKGDCPALKSANSPCYAQRSMDKPYLIKEIQRAANINLSSLKMTYIIFRNPESGWPELPEERLYRIISPPVETQYGKRYYLCGSDGKKNMGSRLQEFPPESRAFEFLKRGELIHAEDAFEKTNAMDIIEGTKLKVVAACGKPLIDKNMES